MPAAEPPRLTQLSHGAGCGCKLRSSDLARALARLPPSTDRRLLVGPATRDDAAVYKLGPGLALVATTDFFTPVVDDPFLFGRIAGANALSDVYAMGGTPLFALSIVAFPTDRLPAGMLARMLEGLADACADAGIALVGGHTIDDPEPKLGLAVTGRVHPKRVLSNAGARAGDVLLLTKPLGVGAAATAIKRGLDSPAVAAALGHMRTLNRAAGEVFARRGVHALTDVTGFGLLGHLWNLVEASGVRASVRLADVPRLPGVDALLQDGVVPGGGRRNLADVEPHVEFSTGILPWERLLLADPQTNGGLLASVARRQAPAMIRALRRAGVEVSEIGTIHRGAPAIAVV
jgi:selenide,water dikinase